MRKCCHHYHRSLVCHLDLVDFDYLVGFEVAVVAAPVEAVGLAAEAAAVAEVPQLDFEGPGAQIVAAAGEIAVEERHFVLNLQIF